MPGMFCRHNRLTSKCPICSRELERAAQQGARAPRHRAQARRDVDAAVARASGSRRASAQLAAARHAQARARRRRRLPQPARPRPARDRRRRAARGRAHRTPPRGSSRPGPYPLIADEPDLEQATWLAFLFALAPELHDVLDRGAARRGRTPTSRRCPRPRPRTAAAYRAWVERAGSQEAAFTGEEIWTPERRFGRVFERLALPGFSRAARYDLLTALGAAGRYPLEADARALRRGRRDDARRQARARLRRPDAARAPRAATSPRPPTCRSPRSTAASPSGARPASTST